MPRKQEPLVRPGDKTQRTKTGLETPVPSRDAVMGGLIRAARTRSASAAKRGQGTPRTSRAR